MSNLNKSFCSLYYMEVKKDLTEFLPIKAIKGISASKLGDYYEVYIPISIWFPKGFLWTVKAQYATEAKASLLSHIVDRIDNKILCDNCFPIVLKPNKNEK